MVDLNVYAASSLAEKHSHNVDLVVLTDMQMHRTRGQREFRVPSVRGVMNYWWRAVQYNTHWSNMLSKSVAIFGGTAKKEKEKGRKSSVAMSYSSSKPNPVDAGDHIQLRMMKTTSPADLNRFCDILHLAVCLGGFGNRSRRGSGSLQFVEDQWSAPEDFLQTVEELIRRIAPTNSVKITRKKSGLFLESFKPSFHPTIQSVWVSPTGHSTNSQALQALTTASKRANPSNSFQYLGNISRKNGNSKSRVASPLHGTVCKINGRYHVVVTEVRPTKDPFYQKEGYQNAKQIFLDYAVGGVTR